jgi:hypothetical protein
MTMTDTIRSIMERFKTQSTVTPQMLMQMEGMAERNAKRIEAIKKEMGSKYILHPSHKKSRLDEPRPV